jgi:hypothetical protein
VVGVDPAEAQLHRGELAAHVTGAYAADAVTVGRDVFLAPGKGGADPAGLGLLAHELTHVGAADAVDGETGARQVEANVRAAAGQRTTGGIASTDAPGGFALAGPATGSGLSTGSASGHDAPSIGSSTEPDNLRTRSGTERETLGAGFASNLDAGVGNIESEARDAGGGWQAAADALQASGGRAASTNWNGLPAPWEPLPDWLTIPPTEWPSLAPDVDTGFTPEPQTGSIGSTNGDATGGGTKGGVPGDSSGHGHASVTNGSGSAGPIGDGPPVHMAELQRDLPPAESQAAPAGGDEPTHPQASTPGVEPDLDALARQVYILLRRRLASERRRFG